MGAAPSPICEPISHSVIVGDDLQCIFQWAGVRQRIIDTLGARLKANGIQAVCYSVNITQRCPQVGAD